MNEKVQNKEEESTIDVIPSNSQKSISYFEKIKKSKEEEEEDAEKDQEKILEGDEIQQGIKQLEDIETVKKEEDIIIIKLSPAEEDISSTSPTIESPQTSQQPTQHIIQPPLSTQLSSESLQQQQREIIQRQLQQQPIVNLSNLSQNQSPEEFENQSTDKPNIKKKMTSLPEVKPVTVEDLKAINEEIKVIQINLCDQQNLISKLSEALGGIRSVQTGNQSNITDEMKIITDEIIEIINSTTWYMIQNEKDIDYAFESGLVAELIDLIKRMDNSEIVQCALEVIKKISEKVTSNQLLKLFQMDILQSFTSILKSKDQEVQGTILQTITNIIKKGQKILKDQQSSSLWPEQYQSFNQAQSSYSFQSLRQSFKFQYAQSSITFKQPPIPPPSTSPQSFASSSSQSQLHLLQLLNLPQPYLLILEQQGIVKNVIESTLINEDVGIQCKKHACEFLNAFYVEGARLPTILQQQIIKNLSEEAKSDQKDKQESAIRALSYLSVNKNNHYAIIVSDFLQTTFELF
ncbi:MAG: hypothetical protein EZS28_034569, partial [Streblomastix strix]